MIEPSDRLQTNTAQERQAIDAPVNLSDGHARQPLTEVERRVVEDAAALFDRAGRMTQSECEAQFVDAFFSSAGLSVPAHALLSYSASSLVVTAGLYVKEKGYTVGLLEPCFDNIPDLLRDLGVRVVSIQEAETPYGVPTDVEVLWITMPNNPTGFELTEDEFSSWVDRAAARGVMVVVDHCFRHFSPTMQAWDQYAILDEADVPYVAFEDTGKAVPLLDIKCGLLRCSQPLSHPLSVLNEDLILNVSPFVLCMLAECFDGYKASGLGKHFVQPTHRRRTLVASLLDGLGGLPEEMSGTGVPFSWRRAHGIDAEALVAAGRHRGVHVLGGRNFFWTSDRGSQYIRIPLSRPDDVLERGVTLLSELYLELQA